MTDEDIEAIGGDTRKQLQEVHGGLPTDFDSDAEDYRDDKPVPDNKYTIRFSGVWGSAEIKYSIWR